MLVAHVAILMLAAGALVGQETPIPAEFRLDPGPELSIVVDPSQRLRPANKMVGGVSFHKVAGWAGRPYSAAGQYTLSPDLEQAIRDLKLPLTRFYALGNESFAEAAGGGRDVEAPSLESAIDKAAEVVARLGIPPETVVLEFENQGARSMLAPATWARGVRHSVAKGYRFRHWEIGNEPYVRSSIFKTPDDYVRHFKEVSAAIKKAQPEAKTVISILRDDEKWGRAVLSGAAGYYDLVAPHWYSFVADDFEETVLGENAAIAARIAAIGNYMSEVNPGREVAQYDTEWGMLTKSPDGQRPEMNVRNGNILGTAARAVRLISYTRDNLVQAASGWEMFIRTPSYGCCTLASNAGNARCMLYWLYYYYNRHVGDWTVAGKGTAPHYTISRIKTQAGKAVPETPALITASDDGQHLYAMLVNGSWTKDHPASIAIRGFGISSARGVLLTHGDLDAAPLVENKEDFVHALPLQTAASAVRFVLPAHSIAFITIDRSGDSPISSTRSERKRR